MFYYIAHGAFKIGKVDRFVQSHLYRADEFGVHIHRLQQFVCGVGGTQVREDKCILHPFLSDG